MNNYNFQLNKSGFDKPWGFSIQGGRDFNRPLVISRITCESIADKEGLKCGDQILKINNQIASLMNHNEAQQMIIKSGDILNLGILRSFDQIEERSSGNILHLFKPQNNIISRKFSKNSPRTGFATDIQISHSSYDLKFRSPICSHCNKEIRGPFIIALDYCFCPNHFNCSHCKNDLTKRTFLEVEGSFYCEKDYLEFLAPNCQKCNKPIIGNETTAMNFKWHSSCFNCNQCGINLATELYKIGDDQKPYCEQDWNELFQIKCTRCNKPICVMDRFMEIGSNAYHVQCFCCSACKTPLESKPFHNRNGKPFCLIHAFAGTIF